MSRSKKDQRGGHRRRKFGTYSCMCCPILAPRERDQNRTRRNAALDKNDRRADNA